MDNWLYFLKRAKALTVISQAPEDGAPIVNAFAMANFASLSRDEEDKQIKREMFLHDIQYIHRDRTAVAKRAMAKGLEKGRKEGLATCRT